MKLNNTQVKKDYIKEFIRITKLKINNNEFDKAILKILDSY